MKNEAVNHTKMALLMRRLELPRWGTAGILSLLWKLTAREAPCGDIGKLTNEEIAVSLDWHDDPDRLIDALVDSKWVDKHSMFRLVIHDWWEHAEDNVHAKVARLHSYFACGKPPKLRSLRREEKAEIEVFYSINPTPKWAVVDIATAAQRIATASATAAQDTTMPSHTIPSHTKPYQAPPGNASPPAGLPTEADRQSASAAIAAMRAEAMAEKFDIPEFTRKLYAKHPQAKRRDLGLAEMAMARAVNVKHATPDLIEKVHGEMCLTEDWQWNDGRSKGCPTLAEWLQDEGWMFPPAPRVNHPPGGGGGGVNGNGSYADRRRDRILGKPSSRETSGKSGPVNLLVMGAAYA